MNVKPQYDDADNMPAQPVDWEAVYRAELPRVYNFFRYRVVDDALAEDLTATTFMKAWRAREKYRNDLGAFSAWLFAIARNTATDHFRKRRDDLPLRMAERVARSDSLEDRLQRDGDLRQLAALLAGLPERERELIALKYGAGLTNRAIARVTNLSESNVGTTLHRVIRKLRAEWETS